MPRNLELPPALTTRPGNRSRVVGGPDMPHPKRSHEAVLQEKAKKEREVAETQQRQAQALAHVAAIEQMSAERAPTIRTHSAAARGLKPSDPVTSQSASKKTGKLAPLTLKLRLPPRQVDSSTASLSVTALVEHDNGCATEELFHDELGPITRDEDAGEVLGAVDTAGQPDVDKESGESGEEYQPPSNSDQDESEVDEHSPQSAWAQGRDATVLTLLWLFPSPAHSRKKQKTTQLRAAFVQDWEQVLEDRLSAPSRALGIPQQKAARRSASVSSSASTVFPPSSTASDSGEDAILLTSSGFADDEDNSQPLTGGPTAAADDACNPAPGHYRERSHSQMPGLELESAREPRQIAPVQDTYQRLMQDVLTKVIARTSTSVASSSRTVTSAATVTAASLVKVTTMASSSKSRTQRKDHSSTATGKTPKSRMSDIASILHVPFNTRFVPLVRQHLGLLIPWQELTLAELQQLHRKAFGSELSKQYPLEEDDHCWKLIHYRINDWHSAFWMTAVTTFEEIIKEHNAAAAAKSAKGPVVSASGTEGGSEQEHAGANGDGANMPAACNAGNTAFVFSTPKQIGIYAEWLLGDAKKAAPFYWKVWNDGVGPEARLRSSMIIGTFAHHLGELLSIDSRERVQEFPIGALTLAVLGATHALRYYQTGVWAPPKGRAGWFSQDNYEDTYEFKEGAYVADKRLTRVLKVVEDLRDDEWTDIYTAAYEVYKRRDSVPKGRRGKKKRVSADVTVGAGPASSMDDVDDDEVMLAATPSAPAGRQ
ncbi:hypothetical protein BN946_scf184990.g3 [Trametes cinnabarina]|uniref:Uncharacterized protein n=1 Tax=Pycnoporus cinnabarinus TaxID=5643 RepID=A0A060SEC2_PYCCI|nr:hypothetical protein BN946_scf184990.g3 [Trametes cinnabarina]